MCLKGLPKFLYRHTAAKTWGEILEGRTFWQQSSKLKLHCSAVSFWVIHLFSNRLSKLLFSRNLFWKYYLKVCLATSIWYLNNFEAKCFFWLAARREIDAACAQCCTWMFLVGQRLETATLAALGHTWASCVHQWLTLDIEDSRYSILRSSFVSLWTQEPREAPHGEKILVESFVNCVPDDEHSVTQKWEHNSM